MDTYFLSIQENDGRGIAFYREWMPLNLLNCIAILRAISIKAQLCYQRELDMLLQDNKEKARIFVSSSSLDYWQCPKLRITKFIEMCQKLSRYHDVYVLGFHGTLLSEYILNVTGAKAVIRGEPEAVVAKICKGIPLDEIKGITFRKNGDTILNPDASLIDVESLPIPVYGQVSANNYRYGLTGWSNFGVFETARGCIYECSFCAKDVMYGKGYRPKNIEQVINEVHAAVNDHGFKTGYFIDLTFVQDRKRTIDLCSNLISKKINFMWACDTRIDQIDEEILRLMYNAGCRMIAYGVESHRDIGGSTKFKPDFSLKNILEIIRLTEDIGINSLCYYQVGQHNISGKNDIGEDINTLKMMLRVPSSYVSVVRFFDFKNKTELQHAIESKNRYKKDKLDWVIKIYLLRFYFNIQRIIKFVRKRSPASLFKDVGFFLNVLMNK